MANGNDARLPPRYRELTARARATRGDAEPALEQRLGALFRGVTEPRGLSSSELAQVRFRLAQRGSRARPFRRFREWALVFAFALLGASVASAGVGLFQLVLAPPARTGSSAAPTQPARVAERERARATRSAPAPSASHAEERQVALEPEPVTGAQQARTRAAFEVGATEAARADDKQLENRALTLESLALGRALTKLRRERDPNAALALFDQYAAEFPNGALRLEGRVARIDALLALGRKSEALAELGVLPLERIARGSELRLLRAELWAERDCQRALADFQSLLDGSASDSVAERALHGRAVCRLRSGDRAGAVSDLRAYLQRYPAGAFANEVRASLSSRDLE